jgi:signal transduction histidine kinase/CheY-like chemotaxis protein
VNKRIVVVDDGPESRATLRAFPPLAPIPAEVRVDANHGPAPAGMEAGVLAGVRFGRIAGWLASRRPSTLLAFLAVFTMGPLVLLSSLSVNSTYSALTDASNHRLADASALAAAYVNTEMTSLAAVDDSFAHQPTLIAALRDGNHTNYDKPVILAVLNNIRAIQPNTNFAGVVDAAGTYWGDQNPVGPASAMGKNFSVRDWYQGTAKTGKAYVSVAYVSSDIGAPLVVAIAVPVRADGRNAPAGTVLGILVVGYHLSATQRLFSDFARSQGVGIEVTDQNGVLVALSAATPTTLVLDKSAGVTAALKGKSTVGRVTVDGEDDFAAYSPVADVGWTVVATIPESIALADANRLRTYVVAITILLLALLAGAKISLYLVFRTGRASNMALTGANSSLERRVAARTFQLEASNRELKAANRHKTAFLANMSHELRTPLTAILGFSELLIDTTQRQFPIATRQQFLEQIHSSGKHLLGLINDLLDLSKIEAGQMELRLQTVSVAAAIAQVASSVEPLTARKRIHLEVEAEHAGQILADEGKLKQMILNLVSNAIKFSPQDGRVTIRATRVAARMEICVSDNGIGVATENLPLLFKEFQQIDSGVNRKQQGTGLGLAITRSFAVLHGGDVRVESELGKGSRFTIDLPLEARSPDRVPRTTKLDSVIAGGDPSRPLVLVVEDDPVAAELLTRQLDSAGFRSEIARTGTEAVAKARESLPVAITLDILLPDHDGWEILRRLKLDEVTSAIPVIVVSVVDNAALGTALGALDYFVKPVDAKELVNRLSEFKFIPTLGEQTCVLVADDEAANREWLRHVLEPAGFTVVLASGGRDAIALAKSRRPALVMLDLIMPDVSGFDVVEALRADNATKAIPIMVLTSKHLTEADLRQLSGRVSAVVRRGSTGAVDLLQLLHEVLAKRGVAA